ncbi:hypothetical protein V1525DRAFT_414653 [Lipomyces kononenkoae]|uniref:Uncharacterized protein n=1 Tax=Lipomyces kononenkoae TaxID=34357 RepID=A0ACC3SQN8_LIPKO
MEKCALYGCLCHCLSGLGHPERQRAANGLIPAASPWLLDLDRVSTFLPVPVCGGLMNYPAGPARSFASGIAPTLLSTLCRIDGQNTGGVCSRRWPSTSWVLNDTIANLVVTVAFPAKTQALAGGVFNMLAQIGSSVGIASTAIIAQQVMAPVRRGDTKEALGSRGTT